MQLLFNDTEYVLYFCSDRRFCVLCFLGGVACLWITILARAISLGNHFLTGAAEVFFILILHLFDAPAGGNVELLCVCVL